MLGGCWVAAILLRDEEYLTVGMGSFPELLQEVPGSELCLDTQDFMP